MAVLGAAVLPALAASAPASPGPSSLARAVPDVAPAVAAAASPVITWLSAAAADGNRRVHGLDWPGVEVDLGPRWPGSDGAPAVTADGRGAWVVAARHAGDGARLWSRRWQPGGWSLPVPGPTAGHRDHHPAIAAHGEKAWIVWVTDAPRGAYLAAASWNGASWSAPERVPGPDAPPSAPAVAVSPGGEVTVVWSAHDGNDAEVWWARRGASGWSAAAPLTRNDVPDIQPRVAADGSGLLAAWSRYAGDGYVPVTARSADPGRGWETSEQVSRLVGSPPEIVRVSGAATVAFSTPTADGRGYEIRLSRRDRDSWRPARPIATARGPRFTVAASATRLLVGWHDRTGPVAAAGRMPRRGRTSDISLSPLVAAAAAAPAPAAPLPTLPSAYTAFGDSITFGTVVVNGVLATSRGYPSYLGDLLAALVKRPAPVLNRGLPGETSSEGLGRLAGLLNIGAATDFILIMEGANDISVLVHPTTIAFNLQSMANRVLLANRIAVLSTLTPRRDGSFDSPLNQNIDDLNASLRNFARGQGVILVDNHDAFDRSPHLYSDLLHPTDQGYKVMAETWFAQIKPIVQALLARGETDGAQQADEALDIPEHPTSGHAQPPDCC